MYRISFVLYLQSLKNIFLFKAVLVKAPEYTFLVSRAALIIPYCDRQVVYATGKLLL